MQLPPVIATALQAGDTVVASSARAARALRRLYGEEQRRKGIDAWQSPDILDWDSWLNRLWNRRLRSGKETRLVLATLQEQQIWVGLVRPSIEGRRLISVLGVADLAQQAYALLCSYGTLDFLRGERVGGPDVESFREWARGFERICRREGWLSRGLLPLVLSDAAGAEELDTAQRLLLTGFDRITPAQEHLIKSFEQQGLAVDMVETADVSAEEAPLLVNAADKRHEILTCALWIRQELTAATTVPRTVSRIGVVVPGVSSVRPEIEGLFRQILAPEAVTVGARDLPLPFEFSLGVPLAEVPMARAALLLLRWMKKPLMQDQVSWMVLSGFLCEQLDEMLPIAMFDARLRREPMRQPELELDTFLQYLSGGWKEAAPLNALFHRLRKGRRLLAQSGNLTFAEWVGIAEQVLEAVHWPGAHLLESEDFQVQARCSQLLDNVAALSFDGHAVGYDDFLEVLERQAEKTIFAPESQNAAVQILGPLEAAGLTFDAIWFLGADDASWPAIARPHPFITKSFQRKHQMPHADSAVDWKLAEQVTRRLQNSAAKCVFSYPVQNAEGVCRPSTLLTGLREISAQNFRRSMAIDHAEAASPALRTEEEPVTIVPWPIDQDAGGAEILRRQAACPFQSFAIKRLAARPMDATDWGLEPRERGTVVHKILEILWAELKSSDGLHSARREGRLAEMVKQHVEAALQRYGKQPHAPERTWREAYLEAEEERIISLIEEWLAYEAKRSPFTVEAGEVKLAAAVGELKLQMRVDRIDAIHEGRVIIDYKTGLVKKDAWEGLRPDEPQLPLYAGFGQVEDLSGVLLGRVREGEAKFLGRVEDGDAVMTGAKFSKIPYSPEMLQEWQRVLLDLGQQFLNGEAQVDPKRYPKSCQYCDLPGLCRIAESDRANGDDDADDDDGGTD
jgi:ATP-dependent helicase/nuclease subunit B